MSKTISAILFLVLALTVGFGASQPASAQGTGCGPVSTWNGQTCIGPKGKAYCPTNMVMNGNVCVAEKMTVSSMIAPTGNGNAALQQQVAALTQQVATLTQQVSTLTQQVNTANMNTTLLTNEVLGLSKSMSSTTAAVNVATANLADLNQRFKTHTHIYWKFEKLNWGDVSAGGAIASRIFGVMAEDAQTGPPSQ